MKATLKQSAILTAGIIAMTVGYTIFVKTIDWTEIQHLMAFVPMTLLIVFTMLITLASWDWDSWKLGDD